jgi:Ni/Co efflux regulator RcnB
LPQRSAAGRVFAARGHAYKPFVAARYDWPRGQVYRRYRLGMYLPPIFWLKDYIILDYVAYGLFAPPTDCEWVRYGPDLLLIDRVSGRVVDVIYGAVAEGPPIGQRPADGSAQPSPPRAGPNS